MLSRLAPILIAVPSLATAQIVVPEQVAQLQGSTPMSVEFADSEPDTPYMVGRAGLIYRVNGNTVDPVPFLDITDRVQIIGEGGLVGATFDPDYGNNGFIYVCYSSANTTHGDAIVSRFTAMPGSGMPVDPNTETIIFGPFPHVAASHKSGDLDFGPDGYLYMTMGDGNGNNELGYDPSQRLDDLRGSVLRFDVNAPFPHVPADNPFVGMPGVEPLIYAWGLRNPFRFGMDPNTGDLYLGDVGAGSFEEINRLPVSEPGLNFGWRCQEGIDCTPLPNCNCPSIELREPLVYLEHDPSSPVCAISAVAYIDQSPIAGLDNSVLFADFCEGSLYAVLDPTGSADLLDLRPDFLQPNGQVIRQVVDIEQAPDGDIYFVTIGNGRLWRLAPPTDFGNYCLATPNSSGGPARITLSGSPSIAAANLVMDVTDLPADAFGLFLLSRSTIYVPLPGSEGTLCVAPSIFRWLLPTGDSGPAGTIHWTSDLTDLPPMVNFLPGDTWYFQYWTRDANPSPTSNTSDGAFVQFVN